MKRSTFGAMGGSDILRNLIASSATPLRLSLLVSVVPSAAFALPAGLVVQGGSIAISQPDGSTLVIQQGTDRAAGDWNSFNIGAGERVTIQQPDASSLMLARVTGGVGTEIFGQLNANGGLLLVNPSGVLIGPGGMINTASFSASTLNVDPSRFMQGGPIQLQAQPGAPSDASVINRGTIAVADAGMVALLAPKVQNEGEITARLGTIQLASGTAATLDLSDQGLMNVVLDANVSGSVLNQGQLRAQYVRIGGNEAQALVAAAVNLDGLIEAKGAGDAAGSVTVATGGDLKVNGVIDANAGATANGGTVKLLANRVALLDNAVVQASGGTGGGEVLIGGNYLGKGPEPNAKVAVLTSGAQVKADALNQGKGGRVILWSDEYTGFYGKISARGGINGGDGGFVETSSKDNLQARGVALVTAPQGQAGTWLLDPGNITIDLVDDTNLTKNNTTDPKLWQPAANAATAIVDAAILLTQLYNGAKIKITTTNANDANGNPTDGGGAGAIDIIAPLDYTNIGPVNTNPVAGAELILEAGPGVGANISLGQGGNIPNVTLSIQSADNLDLVGAPLRVGAFVQRNGRGGSNFRDNLTTVLPAGIDIESRDINSIAVLTTEGTGAIRLVGTNSVLVETDADQGRSGELNSVNGIFLQAPTITLSDARPAGTDLKLTTTGGNFTINATTDLVIKGTSLLKADNTTNVVAADNGKITITGPAKGEAGGQVDNINLTSADLITFNSSVGTGAVGIANITIANSGGAVFNQAVKTTADITVSDTAANKTISFLANVTANDLITTANKAYNISLTGTTNTFTQPVDFLNTGSVTLGNGGDTFNFNGGLVFRGNPAVTLGGTLNVAGADAAVDFGTGALTLAADTKVATTKNITFGGTISDGPNNFTLTLDAGAAGAISGTALNGAGAVSIAKLQIDNAASVSFTGNVDLSDTLVTANKAYTVTLTGGTNSFGNAVNFLNSGTVQLGDNSNDTFSFAKGLGSGNNAPFKLAGKIKSAKGANVGEGDIDFGGGGLTLLANSEIDSTNGVAGAAGADIFFSTVDGDVAKARDLKVTAGTNAGTIVLFNNAIGNTVGLGALTVNNSGNTTFQASVKAASVITDAPGKAILNGNITATGGVAGSAANTFVKIQENGGILLNNNLTINTTAFGGEVIFGTAGANSVVDSSFNNNNNISDFRTLTILTTDVSGNANNADVTIGASLGTSANQELGAITVNTGGLTAFNSSVRAVSVETDQAGAASLAGNITTSGAAGVRIRENLAPQAVTLNGPVVITTTDAQANVQFDGGVNSKAGQFNNLTVNSKGNISFGGELGNTNSLGNLKLNTTGASKDIQIDGNTRANIVTLTATDELLIHGDIISPGFGNPAATNGFQTYSGNLKIRKNVTFEGNIGVLNGVDYTIAAIPIYNGSNFTWTYRYNGGVVPPAPTPPGPAPAPTPAPGPGPAPAGPTADTTGNLLRYQLAENSEVAAPKTSNERDGDIDNPTVDNKVCMELNGCTSP